MEFRRWRKRQNGHDREESGIHIRIGGSGSNGFWQLVRDLIGRWMK